MSQENLVTGSRGVCPKGVFSPTVLQDLCTEKRDQKRDPEAFYQEAALIGAGTASADSYPKAEPQTQWGIALYTAFVFPLHLNSFVPLVRWSINFEQTVTYMPALMDTGYAMLESSSGCQGVHSPKEMDSIGKRTETASMSLLSGRWTV